MTWFKVDDKFHAHPKILALRAGDLEDAAIALWVKAGSWCAAHLTDGAVPSYALGMLVRGDATDAADELVRVGLWVETKDGYRFKSWTDYQPRKAEVESKRRKNSEKVATWRDRQREDVTTAVTGYEPSCNQVTSPRVTEGVTTPVTLPPTRPDPTRPYPSDKQSSVESPAAPSPNLADEIQGLEARYPAGLCSEAREGVALSRRNGKVADSVWLRTLRQLDAHDVSHAAHAMRTFVERHADGDKGEAYLVAIARREAAEKRAGSPWTQQRVGMAPVSPDSQFRVVTEAELDELYGAQNA